MEMLVHLQELVGLKYFMMTYGAQSAVTTGTFWMLLLFCRQLGFNTAEEIVLSSIFGDVNDTVPIWLNYIHCIGNEN